MEYKISKFHWFDKIPQHWQESKISYLFDIGRGRVIAGPELKEDGLYPVYSSQTKNDGCMGMIDTYDFDDDLITWTTDGANAGTVFIRSGKFNCTNVCGTLKPGIDLNLKYYYYYLQFATQFYKRPDTNGAKIMNNEMASVHALIPPISEQSHIAAFLDRKTAQIDTIIEKKQKLLLLLDEKKKAVINEAVTGQKVWDGNGWVEPAEVKDSGVEWIGKIPRAWNTALLKYVCEFILDGTHGSHARVDEGYRLLSVRNIVDNKFVFRNDDSFIDKENYDQITSRFKNIEGDIILAIVGATLGKGAFVEKMNEEFATQRSVATIRVKPEFNKKYFYYFIISDSYYNFLWSNTSFSAQPGIYLNTLSGSQCLIPTLKEQDEIVKMVENKIERINLAKNKIIVQINKLQEYRQSLISEAVTGKIDLSNFN